MDTVFSENINRIPKILNFFDFSFIVSSLLTYGIVLYTADSIISVNSPKLQSRSDCCCFNRTGLYM